VECIDTLSKVEEMKYDNEANNKTNNEINNELNSVKNKPVDKTKILNTFQNGRYAYPSWSMLNYIPPDGKRNMMCIMCKCDNVLAAIESRNNILCMKCVNALSNKMKIKIQSTEPPKTIETNNNRFLTKMMQGMFHSRMMQGMFNSRNNNNKQQISTHKQNHSLFLDDQFYNDHRYQSAMQQDMFNPNKNIQTATYMQQDMFNSRNNDHKYQSMMQQNMFNPNKNIQTATFMQQNMFEPNRYVKPEQIQTLMRQSMFKNETNKIKNNGPKPNNDDGTGFFYL